MEYNRRKNEYETEKDDIIKKIEENKNNNNIDNKINKKLYNYLSSVEYRLYENEEFKRNEEKLIQLTIAKRERTDQNYLFEYEEWMTDIIKINILKHCFDFQRALIGIHEIFKQKNVKNYLLFSEFDLRSKWTELEFKQFRNNNDDTFYYLKKEDVYKDDILEKLEGKDINININKDKNDKVEEKDNNNNNEKKSGLIIEEGDVEEDNKDALLNLYII